MSPAEVEQALTAWVVLHEYFHNTGPMPINCFLRAKSTKTAAALEELRVDLLSLLYLSTLGDEPMAKKTFQLVLAERLMRYGVQYDIETNYDAISSQIFLNFLIQENVAIIFMGKLTINSVKIQNALRKLLKTIENCEEAYVSSGNSAEMINFGKKLGNFDDQSNKYVLCPFFKNAKTQLISKNNLL